MEDSRQNDNDVTLAFHDDTLEISLGHLIHKLQILAHLVLTGIL